MILNSSVKKPISIETIPVPSNSSEFMTLELFNSIEYDSTHLWYCSLEGAPEPFDKWFPAQNVDEPTKGVSTSQLSFGLEEINTLNSYNSIKFRVDFIDNDKAVLESFFRKWQKEMSGSQGAVDYLGFKYIEDIVKKLYITKYDYQKKSVYTRLYMVIPDGSIQIPHGNDPTLKTITVNFASFGCSEL